MEQRDDSTLEFRSTTVIGKSRMLSRRCFRRCWSRRRAESVVFLEKLVEEDGELDYEPGRDDECMAKSENYPKSRG